MSSQWSSSIDWIAHWNRTRHFKIEVAPEPVIEAYLMTDGDDDELFPWIPVEEFMDRVAAYDEARGICINSF